MENRFVTIASFQMPYEAEMAASLLEDKGIPTIIQDNSTNPMGGGFVEIRLQVPEENADEALVVLERMTYEGVDLLEDIEEGYKTETEEETPSNWKDIPAGTKPVICPRCLSINSHKILPGPVPGWLNTILLGLPGMLFPAKLQCRGCGAIFK